MPVRYYLCPYDTVPRPGIAGQIMRRCAMARHIPRIPNPAGAVWEEVEILGNHCLVRVRANAAGLSLIDADPDFREIPSDVPVIPIARRPAIQTRLESLGYASGEILATSWNTRQLLIAISAVCSEVRQRGDLAGYDITPGVRRPAPRRLRDLDDGVPDE